MSRLENILKKLGLKRLKKEKLSTSKSSKRPLHKSNKTIFYHDFVVIDLETTGLSPDKDRIIEIGAVKVINGEIVDTFNNLVNPQIPIPYQATRVNGITDEMVIDAPTIEQVLPTFLNFVSNFPLIAHNANFDLRFLERDASQINRQINNQVIDTLPICRRLFPELQNHKLDTLINHLSLQGDDTHRALNDCVYLAHIFMYCCKVAETKD